MGSNMNTRNLNPNDMNLENLDFNDDIFDDEDDFEELYVPNLRKEAKRQQAVNENKRNKWKIKD